MSNKNKIRMHRIFEGIQATVLPDRRHPGEMLFLFTNCSGTLGPVYGYAEGTKVRITIEELPEPDIPEGAERFLKSGR